MADRRSFLKSGAGLVLAGLGLNRAWAYESAEPQGRLIVLLLRGGLDGLFAFAPVDDPRLAGLRPSLSGTVREKGIRLAGSGFAAHPSCAKLADLYDVGQLAFAPCAGTVDSSRSHFQAQDLFELGTGHFLGASGFMARAALELNGVARAISFTDDIPLTYSGLDIPPKVAPLSGNGLKLPNTPVLQAIRKAHQGHKTGESLEQAIATQSEIETTMGMEANTSRGAPGVSGFPHVAAYVGRMLVANPRLSLAFLDLGNFDTHISEEGILSGSLEKLSRGISALSEAMGEAEWRRTQLLVMSEFGRTARENGTKGSDHGHGGLALWAGGNIKGGRMLGEFDGLADKQLNQNRDLPVHVDWRDLIGTAMRSQFGFDKEALNRIFPGRPGNLYSA